ncbi:DUF930 domain-containing protein [Aminobacter sp. DSM 101952]|uniref:DUF930 domain-containing protein n=1 Tax=Aminobacter sp. DSM 101952 TaxID=2735891 RepID=UPI0017A613D5|nr:DUF930 domain-containing protein [Aminobacter sp. DSM 101952]
MPALFHCTSVSMEDETRNRRRDLLWAFPPSLILHGLLIAILVVYGQPRLSQQQQEEAVNVTLVPPPEQPKPKPPPSPPSKDPDAEKPPESKSKQLPASVEERPRPAQIEVLKPVFRFGDKDAGPGKSLEGGGVQDTSSSPAKGDNSKPPSEERPDAVNDAAKQAAATKDIESAESNGAASNQNIGKQPIDNQEGPIERADKQPAPAPAPLGADGNDGEITLPALAQAPRPRPANAPEAGLAKIPKPGKGSTRGPNSKNADVAASQPYSGLPGVRRLQSQGATGDALATTSMAGVPRGERAAKLCASALQQQLVDASYSPDLVPLVPLKRGNVLDVPEAAFRTRTAWHGLSFRCEVDTDATTILSLSFRVGARIPRDQWARLGLPAND